MRGRSTAVSPPMNRAAHTLHRWRLTNIKPVIGHIDTEG